MKRAAPGKQPIPGAPAEFARDMSLSGRFRMAMLDEYQGEHHGYNPYDTSAEAKRDVWSAKRKRA